MSFVAAAIIGGAGLAASGIMSGVNASRAKKSAREYEKQLASLEANRQDTINPYTNITNPYSNLQVATGAANMQAEENDISLANTFDILRSTGTSAGGATALAQAASRGKMGISNTIQEQEARNQELMAQGQARQEALMGEGAAFQFNTQEARENQQINRVAGLGQEQERLRDGYNQQLINTISSSSVAGMTLASGFSPDQGNLASIYKNKSANNSSNR